MSYLLDTGILLRLANPKDMQHGMIAHSIRILIGRQEELVMATQNVAEFCNVATRPVSNNGLGLLPSQALSLLETELEPVCSAISEKVSIYSDLKNLIATYNVSGKQIHDTRLVAIMLAWQIENILTLNDRDFRRYEREGIKIVTPAELIASQ
jgi:predicted nucleic acid-binding protein